MELPMCRLCLAPNSGCTDLFDTRTRQPNVLLLQKVVECTSIKLTVEDDCPSSVCGHCVGKLNELSAFKIQCIVNNDFYREKQAELRKQLIASLDPEFAAQVTAAVANQKRKAEAVQLLLQVPQHQQQPTATTEVVCLDDDEEEQPAKQPEQPKNPEPVTIITARMPSGPVQKTPVKVVEEIIIDDDEEETDAMDQQQDEQQQHYEQPTSTLNTSSGFRRSLQNYEDGNEDFPLDDYELVEGQEVDDLQQEQQYIAYHQQQQQLQYQQQYQEEQNMMDNGAILTSILLDDEEDSTDGLQPSSKRPLQYFECHVCQREFTAQSKLELHLKQHSQNRLKCFICGKWVVLHLLRHLRSQHPGQQFPEPVRCWHNKCAHVQEVFYGVDQLLAHMDAKRTYRK
ncbi:putative uncharacterized protein DDB_G0268364 [Uranotaenia lowii]|uniref:putative uncharacterized protein DDB_G0268364 n=1 Tax=Uranotaenia lowii TaxID=190385 RepID=UPI002479F8D9|nr:putative uncharacterized protein DDB_G0268364 [Uranotaenia lowii]